MIRKVKKIIASKTTIEGAGVHLRRVFGMAEAADMDPFLLLDDFTAEEKNKYMAGFPWHPHRGMETVTYMIHGEICHRDSLGNSGKIGPGDIQWMTAGSGIIHEEMPNETEGGLFGFQLWVNLPKEHKMVSPYYQEYSAETIPLFELETGVTIRVLCGEADSIEGPVKDTFVDAQYIDLTLEADTELNFPVEEGYKVIAYVFAGSAIFDEGTTVIGSKNAVLFENDGDMLKIKALGKGCRFLLISGRPIGEPISWSGPIVMNTQEEVKLAFKEFHDKTFVKE